MNIKNKKLNTSHVPSQDLSYVLADIKLIIWDLDETLWTGTLSEGEVSLKDEFIKFINDTLDRGIIHSICSKNDKDFVHKKLKELTIDDLFVFPSVSWEAKGGRVSSIIKTMRLRPVNVLFVDDNALNLNECVYASPGLLTSSPEGIYSLIDQIKEMPKTDIQRKRLDQYRILEKKTALQNTCSSSEEFLHSCNITIQIVECTKEYRDRAYELIHRTNQLNYTKFRQPREDFESMMSDHHISSCVIKAKDKFGDYGIIGYYALSDDELIHFCFSCRALGMGIEQYVYNHIGRPLLKVVGDVAVEMVDDFTPDWIKLVDNHEGEIESRAIFTSRVLFKGPCDMEQVFSFIKPTKHILTEFTYIGKNGGEFEGYNHTAQIVSSIVLKKEKKAELISKYDWFDSKMFDTSLLVRKFDYVVLSMLPDSALGLYRHKQTGAYVACCGYYYDMTNPDNWDLYVNDKIFHSNIKLTYDQMKSFSDDFEFVDNSDGRITLQCLEQISNYIPAETQLILLLGSEREFKKELKSTSYINRHLIHKITNDKIREWSKTKKHVKILEWDDFIQNDNDFTDTINHFKRNVYYHFASKLVEIIGCDNDSVSIKSRSVLFKEQIKKHMASILWKCKLLSSRLLR